MTTMTAYELHELASFVLLIANIVVTFGAAVAYTRRVPAASVEGVILTAGFTLGALSMVLRFAGWFA